MPYPSSSSYLPPEQPQFQQPLQNIYQLDQCPNQEFTSQAQTYPQQYAESELQHVNWAQQNFFSQDSSQQFQLPSDQQKSYPLQSSLNQTNSSSQPGQFLQQNPTHEGEMARQQFPQQGQQLQPQYAQQHSPQSQYPQQTQRQMQFSSLSQSQSTQSVHQNTYAQQGIQRNSPSQQNLYNQQNQVFQPSLHSQHPSQVSLAQKNQFTGSSALNYPNSFIQQTQHGQQHGQQTHQSLQHQSQYFNLAQQPRGPPFPQLPDQPMQRSQSLPYPSQPQTSHVPQQLGQQLQSNHLSRHSSGDVAGTYQLFFTGRDDPRSCMLIGEDTKPVYLSFDTQESNLNQLIRTNVYKNTRDLCAKLDWGTGGFLGTVTIGNRQFPMAHLVTPGTAEKARGFTSVDGKQFEWRRIREDTTAYDNLPSRSLVHPGYYHVDQNFVLYMAPNIRIALFRKYNQSTAIGPSHGLIQYTFSNDVLLIEALLALLLNRWIDMNGIQFSG